MRTFDKTFLAVVLAAGSLWGAAVTAPAPELVKYVLDARRHGLKDNALKKNAVAAGWPENLINDAIDYLDNAKTAAPAAKAADSRPVLSSEANLNAGTPAAVRSPEVPPPPAAKAPAPAEPNRLPDTVGPAIKEAGRARRLSDRRRRYPSDQRVEGTGGFGSVCSRKAGRKNYDAAAQRGVGRGHHPAAGRGRSLPNGSRTSFVARM